MTVEDINHRFTNHPPTNAEIAYRLDRITTAALTVAHELDHLLPEGREKSLAITKLEEASMWAKAAIARNQSRISEGPQLFDDPPSTTGDGGRS